MSEKTNIPPPANEQEAMAEMCALIKMQVAGLLLKGSIKENEAENILQPVRFLVEKLTPANRPTVEQLEAAEEKLTNSFVAEFLASRRH